jgi:hypothetical protein
MHLRPVWIAVFIAATLAFGAVAEARKWTSRDGKFSVDAELADFKEGNVLLRRADVKIISVPLEKLSLEGRKGDIL